MEANLVVKAEDLTSDFVDGIRKVFSKNATLHIKVEYELGSSEEPTPGKRRGPKPKGTIKSAAGGKKRGRKPASQTASAPQATPGKKRGPKPKIAAE